MGDPEEGGDRKLPRVVVGIWFVVLEGGFQASEEQSVKYKTEESKRLGKTTSVARPGNGDPRLRMPALADEFYWRSA